VFISCKSHSYADDTQAYLSFLLEESNQAISALNFDLDEFINLARKHNLLINPKKSVAMLFGKSGDKETFLNNHTNAIKLGEDYLELKPMAKNLGLYMDHELRFGDHVNKSLQKAYFHLKLLYQHRHILNRNLKILLCDSLVLSHLNYCDVVYGPCITLEVSNRIQKLQNSCIRLIYGIRKYEHISHAFQLSKWLSMSARRHLHMICLYHKILLTKSRLYLI